MEPAAAPGRLSGINMGEKKPIDISQKEEQKETRDERIIQALKGIEALKRSLEGHKMNLEGIKKTLLGALRT